VLCVQFVLAIASSLFVNNLTIIVLRDGISQILVGISNKPIAVLVRVNGRLLISVVGFKIENKFLITCYRKHTLNTQHTPIHDMLPHPSHYVTFMCLQVILARTMSAP
jgi:hypothetical protein